MKERAAQVSAHAACLLPSIWGGAFLMRILVLAAVLIVAGCAGSPIGGKYGVGNNAAGYANEARARQENHDRLAADRAYFNQVCMTPVERTPAQMQWCYMRQHELDRAEDQSERREAREDGKEAAFQDWRQQRLRELNPPPKPKVTCTTRPDYAGGTTTECE
ncbi:MAG: hypothetical protein ABJA82_01920 [Myxococcales bacterium]